MTQFLIVILAREKPGLVLCPDNKDKLTWNGLELKDTGIRTLVGFFDWLRTDEEDVIGVRLMIYDEDLYHLTPDFARPNYVQELPYPGVEIFFTEERQYNPDYSNDQNFMDNWIYRSEEGTLAISFNAQYAIEALRKNEKITIIAQG